jgi:hypothetical protein
MDRHIPLVISEGDPFTRGLHLGRSQTERVMHTITAYLDIFAKMIGLSREAVLTNAERFIPSIGGLHRISKQATNRLTIVNTSDGLGE